MLQTKQDLKEYLTFEKKYYFRYRKGFKRRILFCITKEHTLEIWKYIRQLRISEFYMNKKDGIHFINTLFYLWYQRRLNILGNKLGFCIPINTFDKGLIIAHTGSIIVNPFARIGKNCVIHGDCVIGNSGQIDKSPVIGDNVDIGVGAKIIGGITIASNTKIGANAVVVKDILEENTTVVGIPAHRVK